MRLLGLRKADIDSDLRKTFERYGVVTMQVALGATNYGSPQESVGSQQKIQYPGKGLFR
jgi:hypothetical protein